MPTCEVGKIDGRYKIGDGHLDLQAQLRDNRLELGLKDDSGLIGCGLGGAPRWIPWCGPLVIVPAAAAMST